MSFILGRLVRYAARRIVFDPKARTAAAKVAGDAVSEAKAIIADDNPVRAAGRSIGRIGNKLKSRSNEG